MAVNTTISFQEEIANFDEAQMTTIVGRALATEIRSLDWRVDPMGDVELDTQPTSGGIYRVSGTAVTVMGELIPWSLIVKILKSPAGIVMPGGSEITQETADDPSGFGFWKREALALQSNLMNELPAGVEAPYFTHVTDRGDVLWLWQTELLDDREWTWETYRHAACRLGQWQGQYLTGERSLPDHPWLANNWLRQWVSGPLETIMSLLEKFDLWKHPLLRAYFAPEELQQLRHIWRGREAALTTLESLPRTLSHLDAYRANFFWHDDTLTLVDWAFVGTAAVGEELAAFIAATLLLNHVPLNEADQLESVAVEGYLAGLRDAGWQGDPGQIHVAYQNAMPLRYAIISLASMLRTIFEPGFGQQWEMKVGQPLPEILQHRAGFIRFLLSRRRFLPDPVISIGKNRHP